MATLKQLIIDSAYSGLSMQNEDGSMPAGHNGPWMDRDSPVRNTAHWLITFLHSWEFTNDCVFKSGAEQALDYLCSKKARPYNSAFFCRLPGKKDSCNGLIGQAWALEALLTAAAKLKQTECFDLAKSIYLRHPYNKSSGLWSIVEVDGRSLGTMKTLNQQIWFATIGAKIVELQFNKVIDMQVRIFLKNIMNYLAIDKSGFIYHRFKAPKSRAVNLISRYKRYMNCYKKNAATFTDEDLTKTQYLKRLSIGYHSFTLFGLALLANRYPNTGIQKSEQFRGALSYISSTNYLTEIYHNPYCFGYNPTGIELAYVIGEFAGKRDEAVIKIQKDWVSNQFKKTYNVEINLMNKNAVDPQTLAARLYECTSLIEQDDRWCNRIILH